MAEIIYSPEALSDFERIIEHLLQTAPDSGRQTLERIRQAIDILADHPLIGRRVDGERRELVISRGASGYLALYRYESAHAVVRVLRIRHQREAGYRG
ncbi:MAG TPA: type II toxin-antitoxin system RelE/ParE family toxin [Burkholderiales bacterium]|nr:type II toxin-antitoxin system RelE/ParE family toxin [Burkholderiales bacterium]